MSTAPKPSAITPSPTAPSPAAQETAPVAAALDRAQASLKQGHSAQAVRCLSQALERAPQQTALWAGLGVALRFAARLEDAAQAFEKALALEPGRADAQVHLGMIRLAQGRQDEGWPLYQARWRSPHWTERLRYPLEALWQGRVSAGLRLLLWGEQGLGDCLQFARYAPWLQQMLQAHGASLVLEVPRPLQRLLRHSWPQLEVAVAGSVRGRFDAHLPLMDLPHRWGGVGTGDLLPYLPTALPYLFAPGHDEESAPAPTQPALKVGVVWQGRRTHPDDRMRSLPAAMLQPLFGMPGLHWVSLQKDAADHPVWLPETMKDCADFLDTARVIQGLDVVLSIDSAVAHLAAAMGKPVLLLLPQVCDWRWGLDTDSTPWYPGMRLFRCGAQESWPDVLLRVAADLRCRTPPPQNAGTLVVG